MKARTRKVNRTLVLVSVIGMIAAGSVIGAGASDDPAVVGQWSAPIQVGVVGVEAALMHTGKVILWESREGGIGSNATVFDPATQTAQDVTIPYPRNTFCAGTYFLPDGRLLVAGGDPPSHIGAFDSNVGTTDSSLFDPVTETWSELPKMAYARWYPSNAMLADGTVLVFSGNDELGHEMVTVEKFDPATQTWTTLPVSANKHLGLYPRTLLLPNGKILVAGKLHKTWMLDPATSKWSYVGDFNFGDRKEGGAVLLPGLSKVLVAGGWSRADTITNTAELLNLNDPTPHWTYTNSMEHARKNENLVLLADGTVLAVGGGDSATPYGNPVKSSELFDPATETWSTLASQAANRTYHSTALLLPDGRVLSAGSTNGTPEQTSVEFYSPPYLFKGPRPTITAAPSELQYGQSFDITTPDTDISRVALIKAGSVTHAVNFDQRYVDMDFSVGSGVVTATVPSSANDAPPGYYMLVEVNSAGVPSIAKWVHLPVPGAPPVPPVITGFDPAAGYAGTPVTISGSAFSAATDVTFNGLSVGAGNFTVDSDSQITTAVPVGATTGPIGVTSPDGTDLVRKVHRADRAESHHHELHAEVGTGGNDGDDQRHQLHRGDVRAIQRRGGGVHRGLGHADHGHRARGSDHREDQGQVAGRQGPQSPDVQGHVATRGGSSSARRNDQAGWAVASIGSSCACLSASSKSCGTEDDSMASSTVIRPFWTSSSSDWSNVRMP